MKIPASLFHLALIGLVGTSLTALPLKAAESEAAVQQSAGLGLAALLAGEQRQLSQIDPLLDSLFVQMVKTTPEIAVMNETYPGLDRAWKDAMRPIMVDEMRTLLPDYHQDLASFFEANLTENEILQISAFYGSPTGQALLDSMMQSLDYKNVSAEMAKEIDDEELDISSTSINKDLSTAATAAAKSLSAHQRRDIAKFGISATGRKFAKLIPQKQAIDLKWFNKEPSAEAMARIERDIPAAFEAFVEEAEKQNDK